MQTDCCSSCPGGRSQTTSEVKTLDEEVLGWSETVECFESMGGWGLRGLQMNTKSACDNENMPSQQAEVGDGGPPPRVSAASYI
ncbi:hypothetical protein D4764_16G0005350 [Takifugu flavidus]|uniref:Uncharacterized protein n=1 Tax=Takifugu flavidus TaxID=433684 RepID=A0A5C6NYZ6_9TELE|nr:hypothetical protein D4764_16G0005350 [Takifugu flavidus]